MIYVNWLIFPIYVVIVLIAMTTVLMENRQPAKAMAWLMVLAFVPVAGVILYIFFGQNIRKEHRIDKHSLDDWNINGYLSPANTYTTDIDENYKPIVSLFAQQASLHSFCDKDIEIYTSGRQFFPQLLDALRCAKHHIHLLTYIFSDDELGNQIANVLIEKAQEGIKVRVVYDDVGCWKVKSGFYKRMIKGGVEVRSFMPVHFPMLASRVNYRNHRKLCIVDGTVGFIGGMNIAQRYLSGTKKWAWRDTHLRLEGNIVEELQRTFVADWFFVSQTLLSDSEYFPIAKPASDHSGFAQVVTGNPTSQWPEIMQGYVKIILQSHKYVYIETPYFLPTEQVLFALRTAALSGVDVRLMIPHHSDAKLVEWAGRSFMMQAADAGVKIYLYEGGFNHSKLLISDDFVSTCGSTNVDFRSFDNNFEANVFFYSATMAQRLKQVFFDDLQHCRPLADVKNIENRPFLHRLWESIVRLLAPLL